MKNRILIVVDMQNDFVTGALGSPEARAIVPNLTRKVVGVKGNYDYVIFTQDVHAPEAYCHSIEGKCVPEHCMANTYGAAIIPELAPYAVESLIVQKNTYGYQDWASWTDLFERDNTEIELCGVCTDICVISNALALRSMYPEADIVVDASCCAGLSPERHRAALEVMKSCSVRVINE